MSGDPSKRTSKQHAYVVHGAVTGAHGEPIADADVIVWQQRIRKREQLAMGETSGDGAYRIAYHPPAHVRGKLLVVVEARSERLAAALESPATPAAPDLTVDLAAAPRDLSEYATLVHALRPLLDDLALHELIENDQHHDVSFLAQETGASQEQILRLTIAARLAEAYDVSAAVFFAFLRLRVPSSLPSALLEATDNFTLVEALVQRIASLIFSVSSDVQTNTVTAAVKQNVIGSRFVAEIPAIVARLQEHRTTDLLAQPYLVGKTSLSQLLALAGIAESNQQSFAAALAQNTQTMTKFWKTLGDGKHGFTAKEASSIERTLSTGVLVKNHAPLLQLILQRFQSGELQQLSDLARLGAQDWQRLVDQAGPPPSINAAGSASPSEVFAKVVYARVTRAFPSIALATRVTASDVIPQAERGPLQQFFVNNAGVDLLRHNVNTYVSGQGDKAFVGIPHDQQSGVVANVRRMQRVLFVTPEADAARTLLGLGLHSATQIAMSGRQQFFLQATQAGLTKRQANRIFNTADQRYAGLVALYSQLNRDALGVWPKAIGDRSGLDGPIAEAVNRDESLATLFGSQDYCAVDSCTSVLSPAAYLCDLLYWLRARMTGPKSALDVLNGRRPDIGNLKLDCPNSETPLPYIDLVNELLSDAISVPADPNSTVNPPFKQTSETQTAANLRAAPAYFNSAAFAVLFGANYPHSLPYSEGLDELRAYLQQFGIPLWQLRKALLPLDAPTTPQLVAVASERFAMAPHAVAIVTAPDFIATAVAWPAPAATLPKVPVFTHTASITYDQLFELLEAAWVQGGLGIAIQGIDDTCDTSIQGLAPAPLDAGFLDRAHRFLRVWRATGYEMWELDLLLRAAAVANGTLDSGGLVALGTFRQLQDRTMLAADAQLAWFQNMDAAAHHGPNTTTTIPLYARVFLNPAIVSLHPDPDLAAVATGAAPADGNLSHHLDAIQAALGMSGSDAATLTTLFALDAPNTLTLANLTLLYRIAQLTSVAKISLADFLAVARMVYPGAANTAVAVTSPFASPAAAAAFLDQLKAIQQSGFTIDALTYLLTPPAATPPYWTSTTAMTDDAITAALGPVRSAILNPNGDVNGSVMAAVAAQLGLAPDVTAFLMQNVDLPGTAQTLLVVLTDASITNPPGGPYPPLTRANYADQFVAMQLLDKIRVIVQKLHLVNADLSWLVANAAVYGGLDFRLLPVQNTQPALGSAPALTTVLLVKLARLFTAAAPAQTLYTLITGVNAGTLADEAVTQAALSAITGWKLADVVSLTAALGVAFSAAYLRATTYEALRTLAAMIAATSAKASAAQLVAWSAVPADEASAESIAASALSVLKSRYTNPDWLVAAPDIMDPLREHRAAALQDYLVGNGDHAGNTFADVNSLFDHFLIDTQMSSCEVTTRVVQAYIAVQIFVERCRMNVEAPAVVVDASDDAWGWWRWMKRYRVWGAARQVFLYPENWLIESQRPTRTEIFKKLEQEVHQNEHTTDYFETVTLNYIDGLEDVAHPFVTGTCQDPVTNAIHVVARDPADPPHFYHRTFKDGVWNGWIRIPLDIKSHHAVPAVYGGRLCIFWPEIRVQNEPHQVLPAVGPSPDPPPQNVAKYVSIGLHFSTFRNGAWAPPRAAKGKLFDIPLLPDEAANNMYAVEALYTLKVQSSQPSPGYAGSLFVDVFRFGDYSVFGISVRVNGGASTTSSRVAGTQPTAVHLGRGVFDGRFSDLELRDLSTLYNGPGDLTMLDILTHAQNRYGPDAQSLIPLPSADPDLTGEPGLTPVAGALATHPRRTGDPATIPLAFTSVPLEVPAGSVTLLNTAPVPFRVVGPDTALAFDPTSYFFFQDNRRCYFVDTTRLYWSGSAWVPTPPSSPGSAPFEAQYNFHRFYHPYTRLLWHQLGGGGFPALYDTALQENPDQADPSHADVFSFQATYAPVVPRVHWGEDNEILDFSPDAAYSVYNWELFFHGPLYAAGLLSQNQQFEDAQKWFHYIFDPTRQGPGPVPQRFWVPKPLHGLTSPAILSQRINNLLQLVNAGDPATVGQVKRWRDDPFNPFLLADLRPVAYMKTVVMQYLDNLIAWADNLFATDSREALSEATLLYVIAAEILGAQPAAITPPKHADDSYNELAPKLDAFANALVDIENVMGGGGGGMGGGGGGGMPGPQTFYFKIPPNEKLLGYWGTVADRLLKLRHCQNLQGVTRSLALFDAPIDPGLLVRAQAAGADIGSVLSDVGVTLPNYRYTTLYPLALDFVNAVRAYGSSLIGALEKSDGAALASLQQTVAQELQRDTDQIFQWQIDKAQHDIEAQTHALEQAQAKFDFNHTQSFLNVAEGVAVGLHAASGIIKVIVAAMHGTAALTHIFPQVTSGLAGIGGSPVAVLSEGAKNVADATTKAGFTWTSVADIAEIGASLATSIGQWMRRKDTWDEAAKEADFQIKQTQAAIASNEILLAIAQQNQINHQKQIDYIQNQIDFLTDKFTNQDLYDWQVGVLADTYFQSYKLAYRLCKQVEKCYQYELGVPGSNFVQFGYWDSLHKGLLAGESLNHDLRRMQSSYLDQNKRRFELSRFISLAAIDPLALQNLLVAGTCEFDLPEALFDNDYPGHYNRHLVRMSVTVVYPSPGKFDNVKATLTLLANKVRTQTTAASSADYAENPVGGDARFTYTYAAVGQRIVLGNAQDDPGLFVTAIGSNLSDQRYLPFEGAGAISRWRLEMPEATNDVDLTTVSDIMLHVYYTALDGGDTLKGFVAQHNIDAQPASGVRVFSARNDFGAPSPTATNPYPVSPWDAFLAKPAVGDPDQSLTLTISPSKFPVWTRGTTITITGVTVVTLGWPQETFTLEPQAPLTQMPADMLMNPVAGSTEPNVTAATLVLPPNTPPGKWTFKLKTSGAADFRSLTKNDVGDLLLVVSFNAA